MRIVLIFLNLFVFLAKAQNIYTYAGTGASGYSGDGGLANLAQIDRPTGIVVDVSGNVFLQIISIIE